ncbi:MAG TPA: hypothetical protein VMU46_07365 [Burkholderiales bacterium]|nr:hypothetical protein [Burkholderiales bacterium]
MKIGVRARFSTAAFAAALAFSAGLHAQDAETRTLELEGGGRVTYTLRTHAPDAHMLNPTDQLAPTRALDTAKLINLHLSTGDIEEAALLSNAPRRRFEVLREYRDSVGADAFKRVYGQYFVPENRLIAEIVIGKHSLLIWDLKDGANRIAGQYFVEIDGRYFMDDVPNDVRTSLRWVLEAYRSGKIPLP